MSGWRVKRLGDCHLRSKAIEMRWTQPLQVSNRAVCIDKSRWRCHPNKYEATCGGCVCRVVAVFVVWLDILREKCFILVMWHPSCSILVMWLTLSGYIGQVIRKIVPLYRMGGAFDPPTQNTIDHAIPLWYWGVVLVRLWTKHTLPAGIWDDNGRP